MTDTFEVKENNKGEWEIWENGEVYASPFPNHFSAQSYLDRIKRIRQGQQVRIWGRPIGD
jgi:hypothetical protein